MFGRFEEDSRHNPNVNVVNSTLFLLDGVVGVGGNKSSDYLVSPA